jgi:molybdenum cofactor biosynthesis protein B
MSDTVQEHRAASPQIIQIAILTVSDTRTFETDTSGAALQALAESAGHVVRPRLIVPDEPDRILAQVHVWCQDPALQAILITGGTGISPRDRTVDTLAPRFERPLPGFGELFRFLSYQEIGPAALLSRATAGFIGPIAVFLLPGSRAAVELAWKSLLLPELPHIVREARKM